VLPQTGEGELAVPAALRDRLVEGAVLSVSLEPMGGAPAGSVSGPVIASGAARAETISARLP
jgi:anti-sigma-K factor RskA